MPVRHSYVGSLQQKYVHCVKQKISLTKLLSSTFLHLLFAKTAGSATVLDHQTFMFYWPSDSALRGYIAIVSSLALSTSSLTSRSFSRSFIFHTASGQSWERVWEQGYARIMLTKLSRNDIIQTLDISFEFCNDSQ